MDNPVNYKIGGCLWLNGDNREYSVKYISLYSMINNFSETSKKKKELNEKFLLLATALQN